MNDFITKIKAIGERVNKLKHYITSEQGTKTSLIEPFIETLGYDVRNPLEVQPEYTADIGTKKGEKVDYCIFKDSIPQIIIECKHWEKELYLYNNQLTRYFHTDPTIKFAILTNGIQYGFYTDLDNLNILDSKPFLEFDITNIDNTVIVHLEKFVKNNFNAENIFSSAKELKYTTELKHIITNEIDSPSEEFVRFFAKQIYHGSVTKKTVEEITPLLKKALLEVINNKITSRLNTVIENEDNIDNQGKSKASNFKRNNHTNIKPKISPKKNQPKLKQPRKKIKATLEDGRILNYGNVTKTYIQVINEIGIEKVKNLNIYRSGIQLIMNEKYEGEFIKAQWEVNNYYILTGLSTPVKEKVLKEIISRLKSGIKIELV